MNRLTIFGSEECMGWEDVLTLVSNLEGDPEFNVEIAIKDPMDHWEEFRERGLVICPSYVFGDELVAVGIPEESELKENVIEKRNNS